MLNIRKNKMLYVSLVSLAIPMALQALITFGVGMADNIMVSTLGDRVLSGVFISNQVQNILHMFSAGVSTAMIVLTTQYLGRDDTEQGKTIISIAMKLCVIAGLLCTIAVALLPRQILGLFTNDTEIIDEGMKYIRITCWGYVLFCANATLLGAMRCVRNARIGLYSSITGFVLNVTLNWALIFGNLGAPAMGIKGAAVATLISRVLELTVTCIYVRHKDPILKLRLKDLRRRSAVLAKDFMQYGVPVILGDLVWGVAGATQVAILGRLSAEVVAANTVAGNLSQIFGVAVYAIASASGIIIGRMVGAGEYEQIKSYIKPLQRIFLLFGVLAGTATFLCKDIIINLAFSGLSPEAHEYSIQFITVLAITIVGTSYQMSVLTGIVRAGGATDFVLKNDMFWVWIVVIPSALLAAFVFHAPPVVVFMCLKCDQIFKCGVAVVKLYRFDWMKKLTRDSA